MLGGLGPWELGIILVIVIAIFGAGKLAGIGGAFGKGVRDFRSSIKEVEEEEETSSDSEEGADKSEEE